MTLDTRERTTLAGLADVLIPAGEGFPSASGAGAAAQGLDEVLRCRPELAASLKQLLQAAQDCTAAEFVAALPTRDPAAFGLLTELVPAAYFMNAQVRAQLGYHGQSARPIDPHPEHLDDGLLESVIRRGPIYRATPERKTE